MPKTYLTKRKNKETRGNYWDTNAEKPLQREVSSFGLKTPTASHRGGNSGFKAAPGSGKKM